MGWLCHELVSGKPPIAMRGHALGETNPTEFAANVQADNRLAWAKSSVSDLRATIVIVASYEKGRTGVAPA
jgi:hypothetical protein